MRSKRGTSLVELLVVLGLVGMVGSSLWLVAAGPPLAREADALAQMIRSARLTAVVSGETQTVGGAACSRQLLHSLGATVAFPQRGLLFTPDGLPRACSGGGLGNTTIVLQAQRRQAAVIVSSLGRVRWELR